MRRTGMDSTESLSHSKWECKDRVIFISKCSRKVLCEKLRPHLGEVFKRLAEKKESRILEGPLMGDHVHMLISFPPKNAMSQVIGFIKGKSAITWPGCMESGSEISWANISGRGNSSCPRWGETRQRFVNPSETRKRRIND
jgi:putative transposase